MENTKLEICKKCWGTGHVHGGDENSTWSKSCEDCHGIGFVRVPKTNADRIRAMSDEELAKKFVNTAHYYDWKQDEDYYYLPNGTTKTNYKPKAIDAWLEWLKKPAEG